MTGGKGCWTTSIRLWTCMVHHIPDRTQCTLGKARCSLNIFMELIAPYSGGTCALENSSWDTRVHWMSWRNLTKGFCPVSAWECLNWMKWCSWNVARKQCFYHSSVNVRICNKILSYIHRLLSVCSFVSQSSRKQHDRFAGAPVRTCDHFVETELPCTKYSTLYICNMPPIKLSLVEHGPHDKNGLHWGAK